MKRILPKKLSALALAVVSVPAVWSQSTPPALGDAAKAELDSINAGLDQYESMARRSILSGGSKPVSFAGEAIGHIVGSAYSTYPDWMQADVTQMKNSYVTLRVGMVASPNRNLRLWSKLSLNNALLGSTASPSNAQGDGTKSGTSLPAGYYRSPTTGEAGFKIGSLVYEDMAVGAVAKLGPTTWSAKLGGVLWNEVSPLTVWKIQPRIFAWDYLPFELEQSVAQFYDYATVKGEKSGRAAWNKKPFQGMQLESVELPWGLYANGFFGFYEGYDKNQPWLVPNDKNLELQYTEGTYRSYTTKGTGIADNYRWAYLGRFAKQDLPFGLTAGANWFGYYVDDNYPKQWSYIPSSEINTPKTMISTADTAYTYAQNSKTKVWKDTAVFTQVYNNNYYVVPKVGSFDVRRNVPGGINFHVDLAFSHADTVFYKVDSITNTESNPYAVYNASQKYRASMRTKAQQVNQWDEIGRTSTGWVPGLFADVSVPTMVLDKQLELELRSIVLPKKFQSPASVAAPIDGIFPYESNMTGAGKFAGYDNGTAYSSNLAGANLIVKFPVPRGHAKISWGLHGQMESGSDMIYFPWRQNGEAFVQTLGSDFTQYDQGLVDDYLRASGASYTQARRLGNEFWYTKGNSYAPNIGAVGGVRAGYLNTYEGFGAYKLTRSYSNSTADQQTGTWASEVAALLKNGTDGTMPTSQKFTQNLSLDGAYDVSRLWDGKRSLFLGGYLAFNSITKESQGGLPAFSSSSDNVLLMSRYIRFEPVFQVTSKFYLVGLLGNEIWKSNYGVAFIDSGTGKAPSVGSNGTATEASYKLTNANLKKYLVSAPIDYNDWMYGLGFNWDVASRVTLNIRCQYFTHEDKGISKEVAKAKGVNDYKAWLTMAEVKMWF